MKEPAATPRRRGNYGPGTYLRCSHCGKLLKIEWATRSIVCACGERIPPPQTGK